MLLKTIVEERLYLAQALSPADSRDYRCVSVPEAIKYVPLGNDFGPFKLCHVFRFIEFLDNEMAQYPATRIAYCVEDGRCALTNAVFLLGAYLLLKYDTSSKRVHKCFSWANESVCKPFRDSTLGHADFFLTLPDCWRALEKGRTIGWIGLARTPQIYGMYDAAVYEHYDDPINAHMHMVVPGKVLAFKGPKDLGGAEYFDDPRGFRHFSPSYYIDIFRAMKVTAVVRLNQPEYDESAFEEAGIRHYDLPVDDGAAPSPRVVSKFLRIVDGEPGVVAVHCKGGLGRTGTLAARLLMRSHGFAAREAIAWVRIVRPGSIVGEQQHYLAAMDGAGKNQADCSPVQAPVPAMQVLEALPTGSATSTLKRHLPPPPSPTKPTGSTGAGHSFACPPLLAPPGTQPTPARPPPARPSASFSFGSRRASCPATCEPAGLACVAEAEGLGSPPPSPGPRRLLSTAWLRGVVSAASSLAGGGSFRVAPRA